MTVALLACVGCDGVEDDGAAAAEGFGEGAIQARFLEWNDTRLNDTRLNDTRLNGWRANNSKLYANNGVDNIKLIEVLDEWGWGDPVDTVTLVGGMLKLDNNSGYYVEDAEFKYAVQTNGTTVTKRVRIDFADRIGTSDVWRYQLGLSTNNGLTWTNFCDGNDPYERAVMVGDVWDPDTGNKVTPRPTGAMTFACESGAIAKCVKFGYRPWASSTLADYHQACTRMVRADYCGDGGHHTASGTPIHVLDQIGIQNVDPNANYDIEAEWGPNGAVCLNPSNTRINGAAANLNCSIPTCGASFASGGLIQSGKIVP